MKHPLKAHLLAGCVLASLVSSLEAQVLTSTANSAPTTNIIAQAESTVLDLAWRASTAADQRNIGQTFKPLSDTTFSAITFQIFGSLPGASGAEFTLDLQTFANTSTGTPASTIATWTGTLPSSGLTANNYLTFDIPDTDLDAGTVYGVYLSFNSTAAVRVINFYQGGGGTYNNGTAFFYAPSTGTLTAQNDFTFYAQAVPEPSTLSSLLPALAGLCGFGRFLRRKNAVS